MLSTLRPDADYCVYCHAPAAGPCATCQALVCADCCELTGGEVKKVAVCHSCFRQGAGRVGWAQWSGVLGTVAIVVAIALALLVLVALL